MLTNRRLKAVAQGQCGYFTARQAVSAGYAKYLHTYHTKNGHWLRVDRALYRLPGFADTLESRFVRWTLWATGQSAIRQAVVSHESALHYFGLLPQPPEAVHLCVSSVRRQAENPGCVLHWQPLERIDYLERAAFCVTTPLRTLTDLQPDLTYRCQWEPTVLQACEAGLIDAAAAQRLTPVGRVPRFAGMNRGVWNELGFGGDGIPPAGGGQREGGAMEAGTRMRTGGAGRGDWRVPGRSFTLVEMLVVIAILSILCMLLLPSLRSAISSAKRVCCLNNNKQLLLALDQYASEWNNQYEPPTLYVQSSIVWSSGKYYSHGVLSPYTGGTAVYECPDAQYGDGYWCRSSLRAGDSLGVSGRLAESGYASAMYSLGQFKTYNLNRLPAKFALFCDVYWAGSPAIAEENAFNPPTIQHDLEGFNFGRRDGSARWAGIALFIENNALTKRNNWAQNAFQPMASRFWGAISSTPLPSVTIVKYVD